MPKMQKIPNILLLVGRDHQLVYFTMLSPKNEMQNLTKFTHFEKFIFIQKWLTQNMWYIGATICISNNKLQKISLKNYFIWKSEKRTKKD
jgi:hypothetical protein